MPDQDNDSVRGKGNDWPGLQELDRAFAENRLSQFLWQKTWADRWQRWQIALNVSALLAFVVYVVVVDFLT